MPRGVVLLDDTPNGIKHLGCNPTVNHGCATVRHCWATVAGIPIQSDMHPACDALQCRMTHADRLARLEHVQSLHTLLLHAMLDDMHPEDRRRVIERLACAVADLPAPSEAADVAGAAWLSRLVELR